MRICPNLVENLQDSVENHLFLWKTLYQRAVKFDLSYGTFCNFSLPVTTIPVS